MIGFKVKVLDISQKNKIVFVDFDDYVGTDGADSKIKVMECYADKYGVERDNIMLIDDLNKTLYKAKKEDSKRGLLWRLCLVKFGRCCYEV